jgi:hypothetical protein
VIALGVVSGVTALLSAKLVLQGDTSCPTAAEVGRELEAMLHVDARVEERIELRTLGDVVGIELFAADGTELMRRLIPAGGDCQGRARVAAVMVGARLRQLRPEVFKVNVTAPTIPIPERPPPQRLPTFEHDLDLGLGLAASAASTETNLGGTAQLHYFSPAGGLGIHIGMHVDGSRDLSFTGQADTDRVARFRRVPISIGPAWRFNRRHWNLDFRLAPVAVWTGVEGRKFVSNQENASWALAANFGARASSRTGVIVTWIDFGAFLWPPQTAVASGTLKESIDLPRVGAMLSVGAGLCTRCRPIED